MGFKNMQMNKEQKDTIELLRIHLIQDDEKYRLKLHTFTLKAIDTILETNEI